MNTKNKILVGVIAILGILVITNPSTSDFKSYLTAKEYRSSKAGRSGYYLFFSIYEVSLGEDFSKPHRKYIGVFKNFYFLSKG